MLTSEQIVVFLVLKLGVVFSKEEIRGQAQEELSKPTMPCKRLMSKVGKSYKTSLIHFWPEEMVAFMLFFIMSPISKDAFSQNENFRIPDEMANLVFRCTDLRLPANSEKVEKAMRQDLQWTMMDEIAKDKGECSPSDKVGTFGLNNILYRVLMARRGATNAGGNFRDGRDTRYKYSLIEVSVKGKREVSYQISGREGVQIFAVIPLNKELPFNASICCEKNSTDSFSKEGIFYLRLKRGVNRKESIKLTIFNKSGRNASFVIINYNSQGHE